MITFPLLGYLMVRQNEIFKELSHYEKLKEERPLTQDEKVIVSLSKQQYKLIKQVHSLEVENKELKELVKQLIHLIEGE